LAHIKPRLDRGGTFYLIDGRINKSLRTKRKGFAKSLLEKYVKGKLGLGNSQTIGGYYEAWIETKVEPLVRKSCRRDYLQHFDCYILPYSKDYRFADIGPKELTKFRAGLLALGVSLKTARNIIDGGFRAMWRDARSEEVTDKNPFSALRWPAKQREDPDPFRVEEREAILAYIREKDPFYYPFVLWQFHTGMRPSETAGLRLKDLDYLACTAAITKSRNLGVDGPPKTKQSKRIIRVPQEAMDAVRLIFLSWMEQDSHVFYNKIGNPLDVNQWARVYWKDILSGSKVRWRKFYATRHTFISLALSQGENLKRLAEYTGTSVLMIEQAYGRYLDQTEITPGGYKSLKSMVVPTGIEPESASLDNLRERLTSQYFNNLKKAKVG